MNIVFDIGNVLVDYRFAEVLGQKGFNGPMIHRILAASIASPYWEQFERGDITEEEAIQGFASLDPQIEDELRHAYENIAGMLTLRDFAIPWIQSLTKAGHNVYYLSNYSRKAFDECPDSLAFMPYTKGGLLSFQEGLTKPDPRMYQRFLERFGLAASSCVFVDDTPKNVEAAQALGFAGIVFDTYEHVDAQLHELTNGGQSPIC